MKHSSILLFLLASIFFACAPKPNELDAEEKIPSYSNDYSPPIFINDGRNDKIESIALDIQQLIEDQAKERHIPGISYGIVVDNSMVVSGSTGILDIETNEQVTTRSQFRIASMSKSFTAMAIIKLRDEGKLALSDPASNYIPEIGNLTYLAKDAPIITINNLLTMTAGFPEDNPWGDRQLDETDEMLIGLIKEGVQFSNVPSYGYEYSNTGYALLGNIVSRVSGVPYQQYIQENILHAIGMNDTYYEIDNIAKEKLAIGYRWEDEQWKLEPMLHDGAFGAMGGMITSIEDFSKYVQFHLSAWPPRNDDDNGPVKRSSLREMHTPQFPRLSANSTNYNGDPCPMMRGYGFGLGITRDCEGIIRVSHGGALPGFGSNYIFYPEYGVGLMAFGNLTYTSPWPLRKIEKLLFENADLKKRTLPVSDILAKRQEQITELIQSWDSELESAIIAENFYLDLSRERRMSQAQEIIDQAGEITSIDPLLPLNQLRGRYKINAKNGSINLFFTLTPEIDPKVQQLNIWFEPNSTE